MNAVIACGGTGGHLFPGIAVAEVLRDRGHEVILLISEKEIDALALSEGANFRFEKLPTVGLPSPFSPVIFGFVRRFGESLSLCRSIYRKFKPQVVLGMGGFTSTAPVLAGRMRGVSTFIHESNAVPGKANRLTARIVRVVLLGFKECAPFFPKVRTEVTGTPIRNELRRIDRPVARQKLGLRDDLTTLLVMGGSQGASGINQALIKSLPLLHGAPF
ncbi:MAG: undecaprenyldiphospho-muramoylpentapeptide beta-N-acetylglucosaminyltransferase, partial [Verrucomicrobia bacterium]